LVAVKCKGMAFMIMGEMRRREGRRLGLIIIVLVKQSGRGQGRRVDEARRQATKDHRGARRGRRRKQYVGLGRFVAVVPTSAVIVAVGQRIAARRAMLRFESRSSVTKPRGVQGAIARCGVLVAARSVCAGSRCRCRRRGSGGGCLVGRMNASITRGHIVQRPNVGRSWIAVMARALPPGV
jgi:hypothetical protein